MDKLQFDSFHKFLVSLGALLVVAPLILCHFLVSGSYDVLISQEEFDALSSISNQYVEMKSEYLFTAFKIAPYFSIVLAIIGVILIIIGCNNWRKNQKNLDMMTEDEAKDKHHTVLEKLTPKEVSERIEKEAEEAMQDDNSSGNAGDSIPVVVSSRMAAMQKYARMENMAYEYIVNILGKGYVTQKYVRLANKEYDIVAVSLHGQENYIYEVKCMVRPHPGFIDAIQKIYNSVKELNEKQKTDYHFCPVFFINSKDFEKTREWVYQGLSGIGIEKKDILIFEDSNSNEKEEQKS